MVFIKKTWFYCQDSNPITANVRVRTKEHIVLDLHMPLTQESTLMRGFQSQIKILLNQQLQEQQVVRQKYQLDDESPTSLSPRGKPTSQGYDSDNKEVQGGI